ncbi:hypothetical protein DSO57_1025777 [Entomophthora muscae]|uniref:Uncharacterized protein n=1 Tax=Entomophthora muscae TaxID=34485 RepID=A0ACC2TPQ8_9FUNG|nr:hypothetical protein DSO57_1025777 [Entomophthora muscae]
MHKESEAILDTRYGPYVSEGDVDEGPALYHTTNRQNVLEKAIKYYTQVPIPIVTKSDTTNQHAPRAGQPIPNTGCLVLRFLLYSATII